MSAHFTLEILLGSQNNVVSISEGHILKHKPTNVGRIALERQARQFKSWSLV